MFSIIISEKGGAERKETFDKNEINVGRVQGNDLMLPKGNVSKHHARLLYRDGRFIVTDLKSTNGTYVNGRKIAQATIVREGDKIYIGDFILRLDLGGAAAEASGGNAPPQMPVPPGPPGLTAPPGPMSPGAPMPMPPGMPPLPAAGMGMSPMPPAPMPRPPTPAVAMPVAAAQPVPPAPLPAAPAPSAPPGAGAVPNTTMKSSGAMPPNMPPLPAAPRRSDPGLPTGRPGPDPNAVSHYPLERDPDEPEPARVPAPPRVPTVGGRAGGGTMNMNASPAPSPARPPSMPAPPVINAAAPSRPSQPGSTPSRIPPRETPAQAGRRLALTSLVDLIADAVDVAALKKAETVDGAWTSKVEKAAAEQAATMKSEGDVPDSVDIEAVRADAVREILGVGAAGALLDDDDVSEIHCLRHDQVMVVRAGNAQLADVAYTSDEALGTAIMRLAAQSGHPARDGETFVDRRLPRGAHMMAFRPPASAAHALVIRKRRKVEMSLEDFVRLGAMSRAMASFLEGCLQARANLLVSASSGVAATTFLGALASSGAPGDRVAVLQDEEDFGISHAQVLRLSVAAQTSAEGTVRSAARIRPDRLIIGALAGPFVAATLEAIAEGTEGVLGAVSAPSLRQAVSRLCGQLLLARPGLSAEAARELVGEAFDVAVEVHLLPDGRYRVVRIAELGGADAKGIVSRDVFVASDGAEGHVATGVVPRILNEFAARGVRVDTNLFKKAR